MQTETPLLSALAVLAVSALASPLPCKAEALELWSETHGFEQGQYHQSVELAGGAGVDSQGYFSRSGAGNAWLRGAEGWNSVTVWFNVPPRHDFCDAGFYVLGSTGLSNVYMSIGDVDWIYRERGPLTRAQINRNVGYYDATWVDANNPDMARSSTWHHVGVTIGFWGNGADNWLRIDDLTLNCHTQPIAIDRR